MKAKKLLVLALSVVLMASITIAATVAYFTDTEVVTNTFTVGNIGIKLDEAKTNEYGVEDTTAARVTANQYKIIPGHTYVKDPMVTVEADSEESYIRMLVTVNCMQILGSACPNDFVDGIMLIQNYVSGWDGGIWKYEKATINPGVDVGITDEDGNPMLDHSTTYEFRYYETVNTVDADALALEPLFETITMPSALTNGQVKGLNDFGFKIDVVAQAIQADGFANADEAWAAYK